MEDYVSFELAAKLNEKGYPQYHSAFRSYFIGDDVPRIAEIGDVIYRTKIEGEEHLIACPTISQVLKWLRETKNIEVVASFSYGDKVWGYQVGDMTLFEDSILSYDYSFPTYEEAALAGIKYVINNLI